MEFSLPIGKRACGIVMFRSWVLCVVVICVLYTTPHVCARVMRHCALWRLHGACVGCDRTDHSFVGKFLVSLSCQWHGTCVCMHSFANAYLCTDTSCVHHVYRGRSSNGSHGRQELCHLCGAAHGKSSLSAPSPTHSQSPLSRSDSHILGVHQAVSLCTAQRMIEPNSSQTQGLTINDDVTLFGNGAITVSDTLFINGSLTLRSQTGVRCTSDPRSHSWALTSCWYRSLV